MPKDQDEKHIPHPCDENDPNRCQATTKNGQCKFFAVPGSKFCPMHARVNTADKNLYNIHITEVAARIKAFRNHPDSKKLTTELGLLRLLLEEAINKCTCSYDLVTNNAQLLSLIEKIRIVQQANINIEQKIGDLLSIEQVTEIAQQLYNVVAKYIHDLDMLEGIASDFEQILEQQGSEE